MADHTDYKRITVNPGDDDDIVIVAGAPAQKSSHRDQSSHDVHVSSTVPPKASVEASSAAPSKMPSETSSTAPSKVSPEASSTAPSKTSSEASEYHPTTLADIKESKMPKTQIRVIVLAIVAIAAFIIWYTMFA